MGQTDFVGPFMHTCMSILARECVCVCVSSLPGYNVDSHNMFCW